MANNKFIKIEFEDNSEEFKQALEQKKKKIFYAWGLKWKSIVTPLVPVDTGRLRQSMHFRSRKGGVLVGTNVKYGIFINNGFRGYSGKKFMEKSTAESKQEYKKLAEQILKE